MAAYQIPSDMIDEILVRLPVKTLLCFKSVCKDWYTLINSSLFTQLHLNKSLVFNSRHNRTLVYTETDSLCVVDGIYQPLKTVKVYWPKDIIRNREDLRAVGSCNGLVCLYVTGLAINWKVSRFLICNPSTRTFKFKPTFPFLELKCLEHWDLSFGFGYDGAHDDYKIVVTRKHWEKSVRVLYIYSFKADLWKCATHTLDEGSYGNGRQKLNKSEVYAYNMLHYIVYSVMDAFNRNPNYRIARFDLSTEIWRNDLNFPGGVTRSTYVMLGVWDDCLYVRLGLSYCSPHNVWVMKGYGDGDSWSIKYNIPEDFWDCTLVSPTKERPSRLLFACGYPNYGLPQLLWYDPYANTTEAFEVEEWSSRSSLHHCNLCIASLVSIPGTSFNPGPTP
ncbi:F-box/kelch-repeat protein At3g23880-like [Silene latifolia]|uniref:F-box/kelch-repeat protein At3g23880-like n=1 Tax=Silene latifolia TaxID=37657 RepID=UPI003D77609B